MLALACFGLFWLALAALPACAFRSIATQVSTCVASFFAIFRNFFDFLGHLKSSRVFVTIFCDFFRVLGGFGRVLGRILEDFR